MNQIEEAVARALLSEYGWAPAIHQMGNPTGFGGWELIAAHSCRSRGRCFPRDGGDRMNVLARWWSDREVNTIRDRVQERLPITSDGVRKVLHEAEAVPASEWKGAVGRLAKIEELLTLAIGEKGNAKSLGQHTGDWMTVMDALDLARGQSAASTTEERP